VSQVGAWPYPAWVAHRGAGKLAPENTLAAFRLGASHGYRMFECDVKLSADGVPFLLHDATLERTCNVPGVAGERDWAALSQLDAGAWHSRQFAGEPLATLAGVARFCLANACLLNIEIKPASGASSVTGATVADHAARLWAGAAVPPLMTSFDREALAAAQTAQPDLPRGLLLDALEDGWLQAAQALECTAIVCQHDLWTRDTVQQARHLSFRMLAYTVNQPADAQRLQALGIDGLITDRIDLYAPSST
jgi:glycerophosphoryl diester phosphodiesterase